MINNRQNGRRRGRNGNNGQRTGNPGGPGGGSRIDNRARGNASQLYEKYKNLARDAQMSGDRVNTEYYLQFADHYFRVLSETRSRFEEQGQPQRRIAPVNSFDDPDGDDEYGDEGEPVRAGEQDAPMARDQRRESFGQNGSRDTGFRDGVQPDSDQRDGGQRDGGQRGGGQRDGARGGYGRDDGRREDSGARDDRPRDESRRRDEPRPFRAERVGMEERGEAEQVATDRLAMTGSPVANDPGEDSPDGAEPTPITPRRRGRPRREAAAAPVGNDEPVAIDADRLPPSLAQAAAPSALEDEPRPRRRRARATPAADTAEAN